MQPLEIIGEFIKSCVILNTRVINELTDNQSHAKLADKITSNPKFSFKRTSR